MSNNKIIEPLHLSSKDIEALKEKNLELGRGTDAIVYKTGNPKEKDILYKIYHKCPINNDPQYHAIYDSEGVNIADNRYYFRNIKTTRYKTNYYNSEGVKVYGIDAVYKAIERQENIKRTHLQKRPILIDDHFGGTVLHYHRHHLPIYSMRFFPLKTQIDIFKELILAVEELINNNIYHIDLSLKPETNFREANVLISIKRKPKPAIIDVDGKSAIYTESPNNQYKIRTLTTLKDLIVNILFDINYEKMEEIDYNYIEKKLLSIGIEMKYISQVLDIDNVLDIHELNTFLDDIKLIKKISSI